MRDYLYGATVGASGAWIGVGIVGKLGEINGDIFLAMGEIIFAIGIIVRYVLTRRSYDDNQE